MLGGDAVRVYEDFKPTLEWKQEDISHVLFIYLPGFKKNQLKISLRNNGDMTVIGSRALDFGGNKWIRFSERFMIPHNSDAARISARLDSDVLQITFPLKAGIDSGSDTTNERRIISREISAIDPDSGSSSLCSGCRLPIFSTPSIPVHDGDGEQHFMHKQCSQSPEKLQHELHPQHVLDLDNQLTSTSTPTCHNCKQICGTILYKCPSVGCDFQLDLLCAIYVKIVHRCHDHGMTAVRLRDSATLTCNACDNKHRTPSPVQSGSELTSTVSYLCNLCGFWVHPDCASLPNAIIRYEGHGHSLFLTYSPPISSVSKCFICSTIPRNTSGVYFCLKCPDYLVHTRCALMRPATFNPVFIRDAAVSDLARLPLADETSLVSYITDHDHNATASNDDKYIFHKNKLLPHPLTFHKDDKLSCRKSCNACLQSVSAPFYSCSECGDFFLHTCCANLPTEIKHRVHKEDHYLYPQDELPESSSDFSGRFSCQGCHLWCNGYAYACEYDCDVSIMDVICSLINPAITHEYHDKTHILFMSRETHFSTNQTCNCCSSILTGICYDCSICRDFKLHVRCALLPETVRHLFDQHPLQLTMTSNVVRDEDDDNDDDVFCEVCEEHLDTRKWYYSCSQCDQSFHVDCTPSVDRLSKIKLGSVVRVKDHGCPVALVRLDDSVSWGRRCGYCREILKISDEGGLAFECSDCYFSIHYTCAQKCLLRD